MAFEEATAKFSGVIGIGGVTTVPNDLFNVSIEEAVKFLESFKERVNEKLDILCEIAKNKDDGRKSIAKPNVIEVQAMSQDEVRARVAFEALLKEHNVG